MGEARAEITIDRPADDVWAVIGNFGELSWMPGVETSELDGDDRILGMFNMRIVEKPGFSAFAVVGSRFELATLRPILSA